MGRLVYEWVTFSWKIGKWMGPFFKKNLYMYGLTFKFSVTYPYPNNMWVPLPRSSHHPRIYYDDARDQILESTCMVSLLWLSLFQFCKDIEI